MKKLRISLLLLTLGLKGYERYRSCGLSAVLPDVSEKNDDAFDDEREEDA